MGHLDRRQFLKAASVGAGLLIAPARPGQAARPDAAMARPAVQPFSIATLSDAQLMGAGTNPRFAERLEQSIAAINQLNPAPDFVLFGGNLCRMGGEEAQRAAAQSLGALRMPVAMVAGEHDWYADMGTAHRALFGPETYSFAHKGVHVVVLMSMHTDPFWHNTPMTPTERMHTVAALGAAGAQPYRLGQAQLTWLAQDLRCVHPKTPVLVVSHGPLFDWYRPWQFGTADGHEALQLLAPFERVTLLHGHCQQAMAENVMGRPSYGMVSTAWAWPPAPGPASAATQAVRAAILHEPVGFGELCVRPSGEMRKRYYIVGQAPFEAPCPLV